MAPRKVVDPETGRSWPSVKAAAADLGATRESLHRYRLERDEEAEHYVLLPAPRAGRKITTRFDLPDGRTVYGWRQARQALGGIERAELSRRLDEVARGHYRVREVSR